MERKQTRPGRTVFFLVLTRKKKKLFVERIKRLLTRTRFCDILYTSNEREEPTMEYILKCGKKVFTGNSVFEAESEFISWAMEQDDFIVDNYTIVSLLESPFGDARAEVEKSTLELLNNYNYIYVVVANRDSADDDDTYEASYHLSKT